MSDGKDIFELKIKKIIEDKYKQIIENAPVSGEVIKFKGEAGFTTNDIDRCLYGMNSVTPSYKFLDIISWDNRKKAIVIGFNPSISSYEGFDQTNENIITCLKSEYGGYYLLNLYPLVSSKPTDVTDNQINREFIETLIEILKFNISDTEEKEALNVILVWGPTLKPQINTEFINVLEDTIKQNKLFCTTIEYSNEEYTNKIRFRHPSLRSDNVNHLKVTSVVGVKKGSKYFDITPQQ